MIRPDFYRAVALLGPGKITAYLQGGLSVTGTWAFLSAGETAIVITDANGTRTVAPIETITALREVPELTSKLI